MSARPPRISPADRRTFYLEILGDADAEGPMLHEVLWWANTRFPDAPPAERERLAAETVSTLLEKGLIELFEVSSPEPVSLEEAQRAVASDGWKTIPPTVFMEFATTPLGKQACGAVPRDVWQGLWRTPPEPITRVPAAHDVREPVKFRSHRR